MAILHYQFESIHPFEDGNGRLGRILILLGLCQHDILSVPLLNASLHFERNRQTYYDALLGVSTAGRWTEWVELRGRDDVADALCRRHDSKSR